MTRWPQAHFFQCYPPATPSGPVAAYVKNPLQNAADGISILLNVFFFFKVTTKDYLPVPNLPKSCVWPELNCSTLKLTVSKGTLVFGCKITFVTSFYYIWGHTGFPAEVQLQEM